MSSATDSTASSGDGISRGRKIAAAASMFLAGGVLAREAIHSWHIEWPLVAFSAVLAAAGIGMTRKSLVAQVLSRGAAWIVLFPSAIICAFSLLRGHMDFDGVMTALAVSTGSALLLARPMLHTTEAREAFAPKAFRRLFLAGSTATAATGFVSGALALDSFSNHLFPAAAFGALTLSLFASAIGVVRMRGWGIFLGAATSIVLLVCAMVMGGGEGLALACAAVPALFLHLLPVFIARLVGAGSSTDSKVRVANSNSNSNSFDDVELGLDYAPARYRVSSSSSSSNDDQHADLDLSDRSEARASMAAASPAIRA